MRNKTSKENEQRTLGYLLVYSPPDNKYVVIEERDFNETFVRSITRGGESSGLHARVGVDAAAIEAPIQKAINTWKHYPKSYYKKP